MPTYEYRCKNCDQTLEVVQSFSDDPLTECPSCGGELRKVFGNVGISFKGSGFYKNDSRSGRKAAKHNGSSSSSSDGSSSSSSDSSSSGSSSSSPSSGDSSSKSSNGSSSKPEKASAGSSSSSSGSSSSD